MSENCPNTGFYWQIKKKNPFQKLEMFFVEEHMFRKKTCIYFCTFTPFLPRTFEDFVLRLNTRPEMWHMKQLTDVGKQAIYTSSTSKIITPFTSNQTSPLQLWPLEDLDNCGKLFLLL